MGKLQFFYHLVSCLFINSVYSTINPILYDEQILFSAQAEVTRYRTPILITTPTGDVLAFNAARKVFGGDASAKMIVMRRSTDGGDSFAPEQVIVDDGDATPDGLNLEIHMTWTPPEDIGLKSEGFEGWHWCPGPGYGIQKMYAPKKGRLIACGHTIGSSNITLQCIYSDDHGDTWHKGAKSVGIPYNVQKKNGDFSPSEPQMMELPNGTLLTNVRNAKHYHCKCRMWFTGTDGGESFPIELLRMDPTLLDPSCQGSVLLHNGITFFSNPGSGNQRVKMTLRWSFDYGMTWAGALSIYPGVSEYSCLTSIGDDYIGLLYERDGYQSMGFARVKLYPDAKELTEAKKKQYGNRTIVTVV